MPPHDKPRIDLAISGAPLDVTSALARIVTRRLGTRFHYFAELGSTNSYARELAEAGAAEGAIVVAEAQTRGRGRLERRWESPPLANLYLSIVLRPRLAPRHAAQITLTAAVALVDALEPFLSVSPPRIKWPNDILGGEKKLAGILSEAACSGTSLEYVILGIGINVNYRTSAMPEELRGRATSLAELTGADVDRVSVLARLIQDLDRCYGELVESGFERLRLRWEQCFAWRDRNVSAEVDGRCVVGRAAGIDAEGALIIVDAAGHSHRIIAGDVVLLDT
jgi:BirA family biotin operon repressor/biotin-[acetyl-CoA-carboxylase] ligase